MQDIIFSQVPVGELVNLIATELESRMSKPQYRPPIQDEIGISEAIELTGYRKSTIYRMSMNGTIPCSKMGKRLRFSRQDLREWMRINSVRKGMSSDIMNHLSESASAK